MKRGVKIVGGFFNIQEISKENIYIFIILLCLFISYILRGLAFKKLLNNYFGFIPIAGDLICMSKIIEKIKENYKSKYIIWGLTSIVVKIFLIIIIIQMLIFIQILNLLFGIILLIMLISGKHSYTLFDGSITLLILALFIFVIVSLVANFYYRYKTLTTFLNNMVSSYNVRKNALLFSFIPTVFYIWILGAKSFDKLDEMIE